MAGSPGRCLARQCVQIHAGGGHYRGAGGRRRQPHQAGGRRLGTGHSRRAAGSDLRSLSAGVGPAGRLRSRAGDRRCGGQRHQRALGSRQLGRGRGQHGGDLAALAGPAVGDARLVVRDDPTAGAAGRLRPPPCPPPQAGEGKGAAVTILQGAPRHHGVMDSLTPTQRDRGLQRLRRLTFGATAGGLIAVVGVGYAAAASYAGKSSSTATAQSTTTTTTTDTTTSSSSSSSTTSSSGLQSAPQAPTTGSSGSGTVTTGGS